MLFRHLGSPKRHAEIEDLHPTITSDHHVATNQISMCDARRVSGREATGDLRRDVETLAQRRRPPA